MEFESIAIRKRKVLKGGKFAGTFINTPAGVYDVVMVAEGKEEIAKIPEISKHYPFSRILTIGMGKLALINPQEVVIVE